jgi:hypothetical protein
MATTGGLNALMAFGAILLVWFALVGWKLIPLGRSRANPADQEP